MMRPSGIQRQFNQYDDIVSFTEYPQKSIDSILRPMTENHIQNMAQRYSLSCSQKDDAGISRI